jgi:hypothetical protein
LSAPVADDTEFKGSGSGVEDHRFKSFMDITPERDSRRSLGKEKMRKLLARASNGILGLGKSFGRKKGGS